MILCGLSPELFYETSSGLAFQYPPIFPGFGLRRSGVRFKGSDNSIPHFVRHLMVYKGISWPLIKEHGDEGQKHWACISVLILADSAMLGKSFLLAQHWFPHLYVFLYYKNNNGDTCPPMSQVLPQGWAGQWGPNNHQRLGLHLSYLVFHNFSACSSLVRRLVGWCSFLALRTREQRISSNSNAQSCS